MKVAEIFSFGGSISGVGGGGIIDDSSGSPIHHLLLLTGIFSIGSPIPNCTSSSSGVGKRSLLTSWA